MSDRDVLTALTSALSEAKTLSAMRDSVDRVIKSLGFDYFAYVQLVLPRHAAPRLYLGTYPKEWATKYRIENLDQHDPLYERAADTEAPFLWSEVKMSAEAMERVMLPAREHGLMAGGGVPIHAQDHDCAVLQVASRHDDDLFRNAFRQHMALLREIGALLHAAVRAKTDMTGIWEKRLKGRRRQVLTLAARGLGNPQIAADLGIKPDTVRQHLRKIAELLEIDDDEDAPEKRPMSKRALIVARALSLGLVIP